MTPEFLPGDLVYLEVTSGDHKGWVMAQVDYAQLRDTDMHWVYSLRGWMGRYPGSQLRAYSEFTELRAAEASALNRAGWGGVS